MVGSGELYGIFGIFGIFGTYWAMGGYKAGSKNHSAIAMWTSDYTQALVPLARVQPDPSLKPSIRAKPGPEMGPASSNWERRVLTAPVTSRTAVERGHLGVGCQPASGQPIQLTAG